MGASNAKEWQKIGLVLYEQWVAHRQVMAGRQARYIYSLCWMVATAHHCCARCRQLLFLKSGLFTLPAAFLVCQVARLTHKAFNWCSMWTSHMDLVCHCGISMWEEQNIGSPELVSIQLFLEGALENIYWKVKFIHIANCQMLTFAWSNILLCGSLLFLSFLPVFHKLIVCSISLIRGGIGGTK